MFTERDTQQLASVLLCPFERTLSLREAGLEIGRNHRSERHVVAGKDYQDFFGDATKRVSGKSCERFRRTKTAARVLWASLIIVIHWS